MRIFYTITFILIVYSSGIAQKNESKDINEVRACFAGYRKCILEGKGNEAVTWTDKHTLDYYAKMLNLSLTADSVKVQDLPIIDKLLVFTVRHRIPTEEALRMDGTSFFIYAIDQGMIGKNSVLNLELGEIKAEGNFARGEIITNGQKAPFYFHFNKEKQQWKIDLTSIFPATNMGLKKVIADSGKTDSEFIFQMLEIITGKTPKPTIWKPLK